MPSTASPWNLWYPSPTQRPRQGTEDLYLLADAMDGHLTNWRADDDRLRTRPAAKISWNSTVRYKVNSTAQATLKYNTVELDTGGMTDLQRRNDRIYLPRLNRPGLFLVGGSVNGLTDNQATSVPDMRITSNCVWATLGGIDYPYTSRDANQDRHETTYGEYMQVSTVVLAYEAVGGATNELWVGMEINESYNYTVWSADLYAFWISDVGSIPFS